MSSDPTPTLKRLLGMREDILAVVRSHRGKDVHVFGSVARGDDRPDSDIDFLITLEKDGSFFDYMRIQRGLQELLGRRVDVISMDGLLQERDGRSPSRRESILAEPTPL